MTKRCYQPLSKNDNSQWRQNRVSGSSFYWNAAWYSKKFWINGTSMVKVLRMKELSKCLTNSFAKVKSFASAKNKHLTCYAVSSLVDERPNRNFDSQEM